MRRAFAALATLGILASVLVATQPASASDVIRDREYWLASYGFSQAWRTTTGAGVTVAVIDTGIDSSHPDLVGSVVGGTDISGLGAANGGRPVGTNKEHGTMVASLIAGQGHDGDAGIIGVAPSARLLSVSVGFGVGTEGSDDQIANAVRWSVDHGADIINMSLTRNTLEWPESWDDAFLYAMQHDVVIVAAAGNRGSGTTEVGAPATMPGVLTVAGVDQNGKASFDASSQGITIAVAAPSENLVGAAPGGGYYNWAGTSGATPIVAGLVALVRSAYPDLDAANVINRVIATANPVGGQLPSPIYGYGLIDAAAAVTARVSPVAANPMGDLKEWIRVYRRAASTPPPPSQQAEVPPRTTPTPVPSARAANPLGTILPTVASLRDTGIPLLVFAVFGTLLALLVRVFYRRIRHPRGK